MTSLTARSARDRVAIREFNFSNNDVLDEKKDMALRLSSLLKSVTYQSVANQPVTVFTEGKNCCMKITDVISSVEEDLVHFQGGYSIPIKSIIKIESTI